MRFLPISPERATDLIIVLLLLLSGQFPAGDSFRASLRVSRQRRGKELGRICVGIGEFKVVVDSGTVGHVSSVAVFPPDGAGHGDRAMPTERPRACGGSPGPSPAAG